MKTDGILFDLDGTLWDATRPFYDAWKTYLTEQGGAFPTYDGSGKSLHGSADGRLFCPAVSGYAESAAG